MKVQNYKNLRQPLTPEQQDQKLQHVSKLYEKQFLREMMKAMRGTVTEGGFMPANHAEKIFREQLDEEYVEKWGDKGGIGLAKMIHEQLLEKLGPALGIRPMPSRPVGPIKIDERSLQHNPLKLNSGTSSAASVPSQGALDTGAAAGAQVQSKQKMSLQYDLQKAALQDASVSAPWSGTLLGAKKLSEDEALIDIQHDNGLKSQLVFRGQLDKSFLPGQATPGTQIEAGQKLGLLSPEAKSFFWNVDVNDSL